MKLLETTRIALTAILFLVTANIFLNQNAQGSQEAIAKELIRFHVRANSDTQEDQQLKMCVKEQVVAYMDELLKDSESVEQSSEIICKNLENIANLASETVHSKGYSYDVCAYMVKEYFPVRVYGDIALPAGEYTAFRIDIGKAEGKNWWCVLYPPLCFIDATYGVIPEDEAEEFNAILDESMLEEYKLEFKYLKFLNKYVD